MTESPEQVARLLESAAGERSGTADNRSTGGPRRLFEAVGRDAMLTLLESGLAPNHKLLDFGCGWLRLGYWLVRFLDPGCYFGIEPKRERVELGTQVALSPELSSFKAPRFHHNADCDMSVFGERFDFVVARSIFTHMTPGLVRDSLVSFRENTSTDGVLLASYWRAEGEHAVMRGRLGDELADDDRRFVLIVKYSLPYLARLTEGAGLRLEELTPRPPLNNQIWLRFRHA